MRRYGILFAVTVAAALALSLFAARPRSDRTVESAAPAARPAALWVDAREDSVVAVPPAVGVGTRVAIVVVNHGSRPLRVQLAGYEDRIDTGLLAPESKWQAEFVADRPGERLAWLVDGEPHGRFDVTGSHLVEGHQ